MKLIYYRLELLIVFFGLPILAYSNSENLYKLPLLAGVTILAVFRLIFSAGYKLRDFFGTKGIRGYLPVIIKRAIIIFILLTALTWFLFPERLFIFPLENPLFWLMVMLLYPVISAYPQEILYRAYFFSFYGDLFRNKFTIAVLSVICFMFLHIIYGNILALLLTLAGGVLFVNTYLRTKSLLIVALEHSVYGCIVFTTGLGEFFYKTGAF